MRLFSVAVVGVMKLLFLRKNAVLTNLYTFQTSDTFRWILPHNGVFMDNQIHFFQNTLRTSINTFPACDALSVGFHSDMFSALSHFWDKGMVWEGCRTITIVKKSESRTNSTQGYRCNSQI